MHIELSQDSYFTDNLKNWFFVTAKFYHSPTVRCHVHGLVELNQFLRGVGTLGSLRKLSVCECDKPCSVKLIKRGKGFVCDDYFPCPPICMKGGEL